MKRYRWGIVAFAAASATIANPALAQAQQPSEDLDWVDCPEYLDMGQAGVSEGLDWECATVQVPVDYSDPGGRQTEVSVSRIPAENPESKGVLFGNPGGPGEQALNFWVPMEGADSDTARLHEDYDLVAVEPRGLSYSGGVQCDAPVTEVLDAGAAYRACMEADPEFTESLNTENTARDMDSVRAALGADDIDYLGYSYGTYLGATYATLYPEDSGRFVLDSAVNPDWLWNEQAAQQAEGRKVRTNDMFTWIAGHDDVYHLGDTPLKVFHAWKGMTDEEVGGGLNLTPPDAEMADLPEFVQPVGEPVLGVMNATAPAFARADGAFRALTGADDGQATSGITGATLRADGTREMWPIVARRMQDVEQYGPGYVGNTTRTGTPPALTTDDVLFTAVTCNENQQAGDPVQAGLAQFNKATGGNKLDIMAQSARGGLDCEGWPASSTPVELDGSKLEQKPLVLQSERDAMTPYPGGVAMAKAMDAVLVTVEGGDHGVFARGNDAVDQVVTDYLIDGVTPAPQTTLPEAPIQAPLTRPSIPDTAPPAEQVSAAAAKMSQQADATMAQGFSVVEDAAASAAQGIDQAAAQVDQAVNGTDAQQAVPAVPAVSDNGAMSDNGATAGTDAAVSGGGNANGADAAPATGADAGADQAGGDSPAGDVAAAVDAAVSEAGAALGIQ